MQLFVVRHAIAKDTSPTGHDADRPLTKHGVRKLRRGVRGLRALGVGFDAIVTSPWQRAAHTAHLLEKLADAAPIETPLLCASPRLDLLELLAHTAGIADDLRGTAVVGHEPWLAELASWLAFGDTRHGEALALKKGGLIWLAGSCVPGGMSIRALLPPAILRASA
jgi:phosphohistidine phosphatase